MFVKLDNKKIPVMAKVPEGYVVWNIGENTPDGVVLFGMRESYDKTELEYYHLKNFIAVKVSNDVRENLLKCASYGIVDKNSKRKSKYITALEAEKAISALKNISA